MQVQTRCRCGSGPQQADDTCESDGDPEAAPKNLLQSGPD